MQSTVATPVELLASRYRTDHHDTQKVLRKLVRGLIRCKDHPEDIKDKLKEGREELITLKRHLSESCMRQMELYDVCKKRVHRLEGASDSSSKEKLHAAVLQFLCAGGQVEAAKELAKASQDGRYLEEIEVIGLAFRVMAGINKNELAGVEKWVYQNSHNLDKIDSPLPFNLLCCQYLNLIRQQQSLKACLFLRQGLKGWSLTQQQHNKVAKLTYLLLDPSLTTLKDDLVVLKQSFKKAVSDIYLVSFDSTFEGDVAVGVSSLKSACCMGQHRNAQVCPLCSDKVKVLTEGVPMLTRESSSLKCRINNTIMDEENYPVVLPSGHIYSISGLTSTAPNEYEFFCPVTQTRYPSIKARKVYLA